MKRKVVKPNVVRGGQAIPIGGNFYYMNGRKHSQGGIDIGENPRTGLEVEDGEVMQVSPKEVKVYSSVPFLNGKSPAQKVMSGENPNKVFAQQENYKDRNDIKDDGTKAETGTEKKVENDNQQDNVVVQEIRNRLYKNITPRSYYKPLQRVYNAIVNNEPDTVKYKNEVNPPDNQDVKEQLDDIFGTYLSIPKDKRKYKNKKNKLVDNGDGSYSLGHIGTIYDDVMDEVLGHDDYIDYKGSGTKHRFYKPPMKLGEKRVLKAGDVYLGDYIVSREHDNNGEYVRYSDTWDINPFKTTNDSRYVDSDTNVYGQKDNENRLLKRILGDKNDVSFGIGKPVKIDGKFYLNDYYGVKDNTSTYLPEVTINGNKKRMGGRSKAEWGMKEGSAADFLTDLIPIVGTAKEVTRFVRKPSWQQAGNVGLSLAGDLIGFGIGKGIKTVIAANKMKKAEKFTHAYFNAPKKYAKTYEGRMKYAKGIVDGTLVRRGQVVLPRIRYRRKRNITEKEAQVLGQIFSTSLIDVPINAKQLQKKKMGGRNKTNNSMTYSITSNGKTNLRMVPSTGGWPKAELGIISTNPSNFFRSFSATQNDSQKRLDEYHKRRNATSIRKKPIANNTAAKKPSNIKSFSVTRSANDRNNNIGSLIRGYINNIRNGKVRTDKKSTVRTTTTTRKSVATNTKTANANSTNISNNRTTNVTRNTTNVKTVNNRRNVAKTNRIRQVVSDNESNGVTPINIDRNAFQQIELPKEVSSNLEKWNFDPHIYGLDIPNVERKKRLGGRKRAEWGTDFWKNEAKRRNDEAKKITENNRYYPYTTWNYNNSALTLSDLPKEDINLTGHIDGLNLPIDTKYKSNVTTKPNKTLTAIGNFAKDNATSLIGAGSNILGSIISSSVNSNMLSNLQAPSEPIAKRAAKLKTKININPQLANMRENLAAYERNIDENTASSQVALSRKQHARAANLLNTNALYMNKENQETELINKDRENQQNVANANIDAYNNYLDKKVAFENAVAEKKAENKVSTIENINSAVQNVISDVVKSRSENKTITAMLAANPNLPLESLYQQGLITKKQYEMAVKMRTNSKKG